MQIFRLSKDYISTWFLSPLSLVIDLLTSKLLIRLHTMQIISRVKSWSGCGRGYHVPHVIPFDHPHPSPLCFDNLHCGCDVSLLAGVVVYHRPENTHKGKSAVHQADLNLLYCSVEEARVNLAEICGKCQVIYSEESLDSRAKLDEYFSGGPDRFYFTEVLLRLLTNNYHDSVKPILYMWTWHMHFKQDVIHVYVIALYTLTFTLFIYLQEFCRCWLFVHLVIYSQSMWNFVFACCRLFL